jgi:hypothetical protein
VGLYVVAVARHVKFFAREAGVELANYDLLQLVFSNAADLLGSSRRDFDAWIWATVSQGGKHKQPDLLTYAFQSSALVTNGLSSQS